MTDLITLAGEIGFSQAAKLNMDALRPLEEVRAMCAADRCKSYGRNWACPPACGTLEENAREIAGYTQGILVQTTGSLEDEFDIEGIGAAFNMHREQFRTLVRQARILYPGCLPLTAGACTLCRKCTCPDKPCRFPNKRLSSMEAYGLFVSQVCGDSGLGYYYGPRTITYTSCILAGRGPA